jgi:hypothetical protein
LAKTNDKIAFENLVSALAAAFLAGLQGGVKSVSVLGTQTPNATILVKLQSIAALNSAVDSARSALAVAVSNRDAVLPANRAYVKSLVAALKVLFEGNTAALTALGISPPKPRKAVSGETRVIANAKASATRAARGTKGKQQRMAITATPQPSVTVSGLVAASPSPSSSSADGSAATASTTAAPAPAAK